LPSDLAALVGRWPSEKKYRRWRCRPADAATALVFRVLEAPGHRDVEKIAAFGAKQGLQIFLQTGGLDIVQPLSHDYPPLTYACGRRPCRHRVRAVDFIQINREINASMVTAAMELLLPTAGDTVLDLFLRLGQFHPAPGASGPARGGLWKGTRGWSPRQEQRRPQRRWQRGILQGQSIRNRLSSDRGRTSAMIWCCSIRRERALPLCCREWRHWRPRAGVVYISCHPGSLARDAEDLGVHAGFKLACAGVMDMFPQTTPRRIDRGCSRVPN